jgi:putative ABC transport system permease protein
VSRLRELAARIAGLFRRGGASNDVSEEIAFHLEMAERDLRRRGLTPEQARREARATFGGVVQAEEAYRDQRTLPWAEAFVQDVRYGARMLRRTSYVTAAALLTLALGIGANTAIFSVVRAVLLRPLPFASPERLVAFGDRDANDGPSNIGFTTWQDYRDRARTFEAMALVRSWQPTLVVNGEAERIPAMRVSWNYFDMLGVRPALGRAFRPDDDTPQNWRVVVISDGLWRRRFSADPGVIGRTIRMNDLDFQIVGVLPAAFEPLVSGHFYRPADMWAALGYDTTLPYACRGCQHLRALGRVRDGTPLASADAELDAIRSQLAAQFPREYPRGDVAVVALQQTLARSVRGALLTLLAAVAFVLLIACANVANLLLARSQQRSREIAMRAALGASRGRLVRQLLTESLLLSLAGGMAGVGVAVLLLGVLVELAPVSIPRLDQVRVDGWVLAFTFAVSVGAGLLFGLAPARRGARTDLLPALAADSRSSIGSGRLSGRVLVVADLALALVLLVGAGLMVRSVVRLTSVDPGFDPAGVLTLQYSLIGTAYAQDAAVHAFNERVVERITTLPGVEAAAAAGQIPMGGNGDTWGFHVAGRPGANTAESPSVERYSVTPDYFATMRVPLKAGRLFTAADHAKSEPVLIVSESTANALWPGESPLGHRVRIGSADSGPWRTVVGVAGNVRHVGLDASPTLQMYLPQAQVTDSFIVLTVRARSSAPEALTSQIRAILREMDPAVPVYDVATLEDLVERSTAQRRFVMFLLAGFAGVAVLLAAIGLYGVVADTVSQRTREIGVRVALGANAADILRLVMVAGMKTIGIGLAAGAIAALALARFMQSLLFEVRPEDPRTLGLAAALLCAVALAAHWVPVRRALRVDAASALRQE